jgi:ABC-type phosphate/phosphonate transport system substrate-binding protein
MSTNTTRTQGLQILCILFVFVAASFAGCLSNAVSFPKCEDKDNCLTIAFEAKEEYSNTEENPQEFADRLSEIIGMDVEIYPVTGAAGMIEALRFGHADIGFLDGGAAWLSWQTVGLEVMAAEQKADGRPYYNAIAWVHKDSDMAQADVDDDPETDPYALMAGKTSCHTSALGSSGMLLPMGFMITNEYIEVVGDPDEIDSLTDTVRNHFSEDSSIPNSGTKYHKYQGSLRCLAEHEGGTAMDYISFAKDPTVPDYCGDDPEDWCFEGGFTSTEDFHGINYTGRDNGEGFGRAPSHPVMYNPEYMNADQVTLLTDALALMSKSPTDGGSQSDLDILDAVFNTPGFTIINTEDHLGTYGTHIENVPGIQAYFADKYD